MLAYRQALWIAMLVASLVLPASVASATSFVDLEEACPLCGGRNRVWRVASMGGYVYDWPSKYEFVFWPYIEDHSLFTCRHCGLTPRPLLAASTLSPYPSRPPTRSR